jgi:predicted transcriptional regulator
VWCEYLESHAMRLYHPAIIAPALAAQSLLERIESGDIKHKAKVREIQRRNWQGLMTAEDIGRAADILEEHGWVRRVQIKTSGRGRPSEILYIHPSLRGTP